MYTVHHIPAKCKKNPISSNYNRDQYYFYYSLIRDIDPYFDSCVLHNIKLLQCQRMFRIIYIAYHI